MVTAYYIMKMSKSRKNWDVDNYYNYWNGLDFKSVFAKDRKICRVCLKDASISIDLSENSEISKALHTFGGIEISQNDEYPKHLCKMCNKFLKTAISFRKIAAQTNKLLTSPIKQETSDQLPEFDDDYVDDIDSKEAVIPWPVAVTSDKQPSNIKTNSKVQCYLCNKIVNKSYYKEHLTIHDPNHHKYVCDVCGKSFRLRCSYRNHSLRHVNGFPFKCHLCPYKGKYAELLKTHMRTHTKDYRYMCTECPARFLFKSNLNSHVLNKHKEREHKCDTCKRAFHTISALQSHIDVDHLGHKTHMCNICGNTFGYRNAMMKHQRRVHKREKMMFSRKPSYLQEENTNM